MEMVNIYKPTSLAMADKLLKIGAIRLNDKQPFTWSSGWKSPIYCDNRISLSDPAVRDYIKRSLVAIIGEHCKTAEYIAGVATAGIPHGALVADALGLPYVYVRTQSKEHGMRNRIEGRVEKGKKVVLVEDLISTGGSSLRAAAGLNEEGFVVVGMAAIFTYGFEVAKKNMEKANIPLFCLSDFDHLLTAAVRNHHLNEEQLARLKSWKSKPDTWG